MCGTAAHLVDGVLPGISVRQWILTMPNEARRVLALRPKGTPVYNCGLEVLRRARQEPFAVVEV